MNPTQSTRNASLTDEQCAEIQTWANDEMIRNGRPPAIVVDRDKEPGAPMRHMGELVVHPEDYLALQRWADRQVRWI